MDNTVNNSREMENENWRQVLNDLQMQMTVGTFNNLFATSRPVGCITEDGRTVFQVQLPTATALEWVQARGKQWQDYASAMLSDMQGGPVEVAFLLPGQPIRRAPTATVTLPPVNGRVNGHAPTQQPAAASVAETDDMEGEVIIDRRKTEYPKARPAGYMTLPHYTLRFWRPFLGALPFDFYMLMNSYWHDMDKVQVRDDWPSLSEFALCMGIGDRSTITGRERKDAPDQPGLIQVLEGAGLFVYRSTGKGRGTKHLFEAFLEVDELPILTPAQVYGVRPGHPLYKDLLPIERELYKGFDPRMQRLHRKFLAAKAHKTKLTIEEWEAIESLTLVPSVSVDYRQI